jgi:hypothetical protein
MEKYVADIEQSMAFLMSGELSKKLRKDEAVQHLSRARDLLEAAGLAVHSARIDTIIKRAQSIDESDIEVSA